MTRSSQAAFSLVELVVVGAVVSVLCMLLVPVANVIARSGSELRCRSNFRQFGIATQEYALDNGGKLPLSAFTDVGTVQEVAFYLSPYLLTKKAARRDHDNTVAVLEWECPDSQWVYGFNAFMSEAHLTHFSKPSDQIYGIEMRNGRWLDLAVLTYKTADLIRTNPKPHSGRVNVLFLDGHVAEKRVSELRWAQITRDTASYKASDELRAVGAPQYDR